MTEISKLRKYRNQLGLTLRDVAKATGLSHVTIYNIETGKIDSGYKKIQKLERFYQNKLSNGVQKYV
jgi:transcriptional regulator with XRE-family HTH domain